MAIRDAIVVVVESRMPGGVRFRARPTGARGAPTPPREARSTDRPPIDECGNQRDTTFTLMSRAPRDELVAYEQRMGWKLSWYSSFANTFNRDLGLTTDAGYRTNGRGVDWLRLDLNLLDLTPYGRQEAWEDSPDGSPKRDEAGSWWRGRDEYEGAIR